MVLTYMVNPENEPVTVVIVNYNAGAWLLKTIQSCLSQVQEVIIVDNASTDDSLSQVRKTFVNETKIK